MIATLPAAVLLALLPPGSPAGEPGVRLSVRPMPAPKPALKYLLLPEVLELNPGNPVQWYLRCFQEQRNFFFGKEATAERARYLAMPLAELPVEQLRGYGGAALTQADWAARLDNPDWQVVSRLQAEGMDLLLPELEPLRILAGALRVRFRAQVAGRHFDDAVRTAKTMFALARHLGEHPTGAANRLGLSVAELALDTLEEMVQQPGCPNLYWALTDLPCPLVDLRKGLQGDRALVEAEFRPLRDDAAMTEAQVEEFVSRLSGRIGFVREQEGLPPRSLRVGLRVRAKDPDRVRAARSRLTAAGGAKEINPSPASFSRRDFPAVTASVGKLFLRSFLVESFPPAQVILLDEKRAYEVRRDERLKLLALAPWQIDALVRGEHRGRDGDGLFADLLLPDVVTMRRAQGRLEQRVALLRHVEALRLYAAAHGGALPRRLSDVRVPLPPDPFTGQPFRYEADGATAHLRGCPPPGDEKNPADKHHYQVTMK
jgi:hypothetical protein